MPKKNVGVTRETADRLLKNLRTRAEGIDGDPQYLYGISRLAVFGSYLTTRVQTLREDLDWGLSAETGATRIPDTHHMTLDYVREFGLTLEPFKGGDLADVLHLRGQNYVSRTWPGTGLAAAVDSGGAAPGPWRHGEALHGWAVGTGEG
jgi:hypothetical protein